MKKTVILLSAILLLALSFSASAAVTRSSSPGTVIDSATNLCTGTDGTGGITDTISYPENGVISDVNVRTEITHTWRSDLQMHVSYSVGAAGNIVLAADHGGFNEDDYFATFDDESANGTCATVCGSGTTPACTAAGATDCVPDVALSAFDTLTSPGDWTITICDDAGGDTGTLDLWEMTVDGSDELPIELLEFTVD